jgi:hypothetical protein
LQESVVVVELVVLFSDGFDAVEDGDKRLLERSGMPAYANVSRSRINGGLRTSTDDRISSRAAFPILSMSSLVRRGLMALTSSGPNSDSTGPTAELSRGTTRGPLLFRLGSRGRVGIG